MRNAQTSGRLGKGQRSHDVVQMGKEVSDYVLCFSSRFAYSKRQKYGRSPNVAAIDADYGD